MSLSRAFSLSILVQVLLAGTADGQRTARRALLAPAAGPATLAVVSSPGGAQLSWAGVAGVGSYQVLRGPDSVNVAPVGGPVMATGYVDSGVPAGTTVFYRVAALHPDGRQGRSGAVAYTAPPPIGMATSRTLTGLRTPSAPAGTATLDPAAGSTPPPPTAPRVNPGWIRATPVAGIPGAVDLKWERPREASAFLVTGPSIPSGTKFSGDAIRIFNVPRGPRTWRVTAIYPEGSADTATGPTATAIIRTLPRSLPPYLWKPGRSSDQDVALQHAGAFREYTQKSRESAWAYIENTLGHSSFKTGTPAKYENITDLAKPRQTECSSFLDGRTPRTVCWSMSGMQLTMIVAQPAGMQFAAWHFESDPGFLSYDALAMFSQVLATKLDSEGDKLVPFSCMSCHGGTYDPQTKLVSGATLLPIDPSLVKLDPATTQESVRRINELVYITTPSVSVRNYIYGLYRGQVAVPGAVAVADYIPSSWTQHRSFYLDVVRKNCVMCHINGPSNLDFTNSINFFGNKDLVHAAVCGSKSMPHAEPAFNRFWMEDTGNIYVPGLFAAVLGKASCE